MLMVRPSLLLFCLCLLASDGASAQEQTQSPLNKARDNWHLCIAKEALQLDDGISPASDIASAIQTTCSAEFDAMLDRMTLNPEMRYRFSATRLEATKEVGISIVLKMRAKKRASEVPPK